MTGAAKPIEFDSVQPFGIADGGWISARVDMRRSGTVTRFAANTVLRRLDRAMCGQAGLSRGVAAETARNGSTGCESGIRQIQRVLMPRRGGECFNR